MSGERGATGHFCVAVVDAQTHVVVRPRGELDIATEHVLVAALEALPEDPRPLVLELTEVPFMDASGLRSLLEARRLFGERLIVPPAPPQVESLLRLTGVDAELRDHVAAPDRALARHAANVTLLRRLWGAYRSGGVARLARWLPAPAGEDGAVPARGPRWGADDLHRFWAAGIAAAGVPARFDAVGDNVLVGCVGPGGAVVSELAWTVYVFRGRTFIRAVSCASEAEARACARAGCSDQPGRPAAR